MNDEAVWVPGTIIGEAMMGHSENVSSIKINVLNENGEVVRDAAGNPETTFVQLSAEQLSDIVSHSMQIAIMQKNGLPIGNVLAELEQAIDAAGAIEQMKQNVGLRVEHIKVADGLAKAVGNVIVLSSAKSDNLLVMLAPTGMPTHQVDQLLREAVVGTAQVPEATDDQTKIAKEEVEVNISQTRATLLDFGFSLPTHVSHYEVEQLVVEFIEMVEPAQDDDGEDLTLTVPGA